jgi:hypothetical protein
MFKVVNMIISKEKRSDVVQDKSNDDEGEENKEKNDTNTLGAIKLILLDHLLDDEVEKFIICLHKYLVELMQENENLDLEDYMKKYGLKIGLATLFIITIVACVLSYLNYL